MQVRPQVPSTFGPTQVEIVNKWLQEVIDLVGLGFMRAWDDIYINIFQFITKTWGEIQAGQSHGTHRSGFPGSLVVIRVEPVNRKTPCQVSFTLNHNRKWFAIYAHKLTHCASIPYIRNFIFSDSLPSTIQDLLHTRTTD